MLRLLSILFVSIFICSVCAIAANSPRQNQLLEQFLSEKLIDDYGFDPDYVSIKLIRCDFSLDDIEQCEIKADPMMLTSPKGRFPMRLELYKDGAIISKGAVSLDVRIYADLLTPKRRIKRLEILTSDMFEPHRFDVTSLSEQMLFKSGQIKNCRTKQNLSEGRYVSLNKIERIPDIENGSTISVVAGSEFFEIRLRGTALQNGYIGETIKVRNKDSKKILTGVITAPNVVEVGF